MNVFRFVVLLFLIIILQYSKYIQTYMYPFLVLKCVDQNKMLSVEVVVLCGSNFLRCTTKDKNDLIFNGIFFCSIFWSPSILMNQNVSSIL